MNKIYINSGVGPEGSAETPGVRSATDAPSVLGLLWLASVERVKFTELDEEPQ